MNLTKILNELRGELLLVEQTIIAFERLHNASGRRRGRPPKILTELKRASAERQAVLGRPKKAVEPVTSAPKTLTAGAPQ